MVKRGSDNQLSNVNIIQSPAYNTYNVMSPTHQQHHHHQHHHQRSNVNMNVNYQQTQYQPQHQQQHQIVLIINIHNESIQII